ncbi:MAG: outer membrane protein assembly factor BamE [Porticoccaceae bacterium]|nr:outer membrane protein assembly factor BamE [Porticoccaceae bacterium]
MRKLTLSLILLSVISTGCSWIKFPGVHKVDIQQGNILDQDMVDKLLPGMTKSQVRFVLGTPLIADTFNQARWDYIYRRVSAAGEKTEENVTVYFDNEDKLDRITGDYAPTSISTQADPSSS